MKIHKKMQTVVQDSTTPADNSKAARRGRTQEVPPANQTAVHKDPIASQILGGTQFNANAGGRSVVHPTTLQVPTGAPTALVFGGRTYPLSSTRYGNGPGEAWHGSVGTRFERDMSQAQSPLAWTTLADDPITIGSWTMQRATDRRMSGEFYVPGTTTDPNYDMGLLRGQLLIAPAGQPLDASTPNHLTIPAEIVKSDGQGGFGPYGNNFRIIAPVDDLILGAQYSRPPIKDWQALFLYSVDGGTSWAAIGTENEIAGGRPWPIKITA
jgi:hypothetical protein